MTDKSSGNNSCQKDQILDLLDTNERENAALELLDVCLPQLAVNIELLLQKQEARLLYKLAIQNNSPVIHIVLKLKKFAHDVIVRLDSSQAIFVVGSERDGMIADNAVVVCGIVKTILMKVRV